MLSAKRQGAERRSPPPFGSRPSGQSFDPVGTQTLTFEREGKSYSFDLHSAFRLGAYLGGASEIERPIEENGWLAAMANAKSTAVAMPTLRIYASDDPEKDDEITDDPLVTLLTKRHNRLTTARDALRRSVYNRIDTGEHWWLLADVDGRPVAATDRVGLEIPEPVQIITVSGAAVGDPLCDNFGLPTAWPIAFQGRGTINWPTSAMLGFIDPDPSNQFRGMGCVDAAMRWLQTEFQAQRYIEAIARNSGQPGGVLTAKDGTSAEEIERLTATLNDRVSNAGNANRMLVLAGVEFTQSGFAPKDMEFHVLLEWVRELLSVLTGVPLAAIGVFKDANYSMLEAALRAMWTGANGVLAFLASIERVLNESFFPRMADKRKREWRAYFDTSNVAALQVDRTAQIEAATRTAVAVGIPFNASLALYGVDATVEGGDEVHDPFAGIDPEAPEINGDATPGDPSKEAVVGEGVQSQLLNGAQMQTAVDIVAGVTSGELPRDSALALLQTLLGLTPQQANAILGSAEPREPEPAPADTEKSLTFKDARDLDTREKRIEYWRAIEKAVQIPGERIMKAAAMAFDRRYAEAQLAKIRAFAAGKKSCAEAIHKANELTAQEAELARRVEVLQLNRAEWEAKMLKLFESPIKRVTSLALTNAAAETGGLSIGIGHPSVVEMMARQGVQLAEGVTSTLANRVQTVLVEELSKATSLGDLQAAVREVLPELEGSVARVFANRDARAQTIARTESGHAAESARFEQFQSDGITKLRWITQADGEVRESHAMVDGDVALMGSTFKNGLRYPLDPRGDAEDVINCRCSAAPVFEDIT